MKKKKSRRLVMKQRQIKLKKRKEENGRKEKKSFENDSTCVTGEVLVLVSDKSVAEKPNLNVGIPRVTVGILTVDGGAAP